MSGILSSDAFAALKRGLSKLTAEGDAYDCLQSFSQDQHTLLSIFLPRSLSLPDAATPGFQKSSLPLPYLRF